MSIYREEAIEALIEALRRKDFPNSQIMALDALSSLSGRLTVSGKSCTEAWLLKTAGFDKPYNALVKAEKLKVYDPELTETMVYTCVAFGFSYSLFHSSILSRSEIYNATEFRKRKKKLQLRGRKG